MIAQATAGLFGAYSPQTGCVGDCTDATPTCRTVGRIGMSELAIALRSLAAKDRRRLLHDLRQQEPLDTAESTTVVANGSGRDLDELEAELHHVHLPKLVDAGYIEHDRETGEVRRGPKFDQIAPLLRLMANHPDELPDGWF